MRLTIVAAAIAFLSVACSSDPEPIDPASVQIFTGYCTGTLLAEHAAMRWIGQSQWSGSERIPAGTKFLLSESFDKPFGYVVYDDDSLRRLDEDGFQEGVAFSSDCESSVTARVLLVDATLHASESLDGDGCELEAGMSFASLSVILSGTVAEVEAPEVEATCGFNPGYSDDFVADRLFVL